MLDAWDCLDVKIKLLGLIRHALTFGGGYLVSTEWISAELLPELIAGIMTVIGVIWSVKAPEKKS